MDLQQEKVQGYAQFRCISPSYKRIQTPTGSSGLFDHRNSVVCGTAAPSIKDEINITLCYLPPCKELSKGWRKGEDSNLR